MKFLIQVFFIAIMGFVLELFFPWWTIAIAAFIGGALVTSSANFWAGFIGIALLWSTKAFLIDLTAATVLSEKVALIFQLSNKFFLIGIMCLFGGLVGGFASLSGSLTKKKRRLRY
jgi:hypothetical protein